MGVTNIFNMRIFSSVVFNIILCWILIYPINIFSQEQVVNGISFNAPEGFIKTEELTWQKGNETIHMKYFGSNIIDEKYFQAQCANGTRTTEYLLFDSYTINGEKYFYCLQYGENGLIIGQIPVYKDGYTYFFTASVHPVDFEEGNSDYAIVEDTCDRVFFLLGYMLSRVKYF